MLKGLLAISGHSGLFRLVAESKNNIIVESLDANKRMPVYSVSKVSSLEDISVYTQTGETPLKEILKVISDKENGNASINPKLPENKLREYFEGILPNYDKSRVYVSDIKKILLWYNILQSKNMLDFAEENQNEKE
ncbi:MAG: DUF5606 domain-containing protein [Bacteroidales bacterium]|nr:DUF5606 domain-containing protein [Bacteroidales bacterium]